MFQNPKKKAAEKDKAHNEWCWCYDPKPSSPLPAHEVSSNHWNTNFPPQTVWGCFLCRRYMNNIYMHNYIVPYSSRIYDSDIAFAWIWGANPLWLWYSSTKYAECFQIRILWIFSTSSVLRFWQARQQVNSLIFWCKRGTTSKAHVRGNPPRQIFVAGRRIPKLKWGHFWKILREVKVTTNLPEMNFNYWGSNCNSSDLHLPTHATWKHTWKVINC